MSVPAPEGMVGVDNCVTIKFDGESHSVDVATFVNVVMSYSGIVNAAAKELNLPSDVRVSVTATNPGSLDIVLSLTQGASGLLSLIRDNKDGIESVIILAAGVYKLKQKVAGWKKIDSVKEGSDGESVIIMGDGGVVDASNHEVNVYINASDEFDNLNAAFFAMEESPGITGFEMLHGGNSLFRAESWQFSDLSRSPEYEDGDIKHVVRTGWLTVVKPYLGASSSRKWEFAVGATGMKLSAPIVDEGFLDRLDDLSFMRGTMMHVEVDITQKKEKDGSYKDKRYTITKVIEVKSPARPMSLFEDAEEGEQ